MDGGINDCCCCGCSSGEFARDDVEDTDGVREDFGGSDEIGTNFC